MGFLDIFKKQNNTAQIAKERLQIIVAHQRDGRISAPNEQPLFMEEMKREILEVVRKYIHIEPQDIETNIERDGEAEALVLNINLPDKQQQKRGNDSPAAQES